MVTVITRTNFPQVLWETMESLTERSIVIFKEQPGFIDMEVLQAIDKSGTLTIFKWASLADHENCMLSEDWSELNTEWNEFLNRDDVHFEFLFTGSSWK